MADDTDAALDMLAEMGYSGGVAVAALLRAGGDVTAAANLLAEEECDETGSKKGKRAKKGAKKKEPMAAHTGPPPRSPGRAKPVETADQNSDDSDDSDDSGARSKKDVNKKGGKKKGDGGGRELSFKEKRQAEIEARKAKRDARQVCRVCGGPHPRKECPGVMDGGRGQSRWHDQAARKKDGKQRRKQEAREEDTSALLSIGLWTADTPYYDGFADLHATFVAQQKEVGKKGSSGDGTSPMLSPQRSPHRSTIGTADVDALSLDGPEPVDGLTDWTPPTTPGCDNVIPGSAPPCEPQHQPTQLQNEQREDDAAPATASLLARWIEDWARLEAVVLEAGHGGSSAIAEPHHKLKKELLGTRLMKLQERAYSTPGISNADVAAAVESNDPKGALAQLILAAPQEEEVPRTVASEWPGYRGGLAPFSVMDPAALDALAHLLSLTFATTDPDEADSDTANPSSACGLRALLAVPPAEVARWMVIDAPAQHEDAAIALIGGESIGISLDEDAVETDEEAGDYADANANAESEDAPKEEPIDITVVVREAEQAGVEINRTEALLAVAKQEVVNCQQKGNVAAATAAVERLGRLLVTQRARAASTAAGSEEWLATASSARLSRAVEIKLHEAIAQIPGTSDGLPVRGANKRVVGVSCGLDYRTPEAVHPITGHAVRAAQQAACVLAVSAAVAAELPVVLECHDAPLLPEPAARPAAAQSAARVEPEPQAEAKLIESASSDLVKILVKAAPPSTTLILRSGSLTVAPKPGLAKLMQVWPNLYVGLSSSLTYSKCSKELLDAAFDLPLDRLILTSESPNALPAVLGGSRRTQVCIPPHVACAAEHIATIKEGTVPGLDRALVLRHATSNLCNAFGLSMLVGPAPLQAAAATTCTGDAIGEPSVTESTCDAKVFMKKPNSGPMMQER